MYNSRNIDKTYKASTVTLKNWVGLDTRSSLEDDTIDNQSNNILSQSNTQSNYSDINNYNATDLLNNHTLEPYQNIEALAHYLTQKIDALHNKQIDIRNIEIITDRVFHSIEKLKQEIRNTSGYVQTIEHKNRGLEDRIELLITQNEAMIEHCTQIEAMCKSFFSRNVELENKFLALNQKIYSLENSLYDHKSSEQVEITEPSEKYSINKDIHSNNFQGNIFEINPKITTDLEENDAVNNVACLNKTVKRTETDNHYTHSAIIKSQKNTAVKDEEIDIKELIKSKNKVESFIKSNYPDDYRIIKQYNRHSILNWVNRVLGLN